MKLFIKHKQIHRFREQTYGYKCRWKGLRAEIVREFDMYISLYLKWITHCIAQPKWEKFWKRIDTCICIIESFVFYLTLLQHF